MKETWNQIWVKTKKSIKGLLIFSGFMNALFVISYIYGISDEQNVWFLVQLVIFSYLIFFVIAFVFTIALVTLAVFTKKKNRIAVSILVVFLILYVLILAKGFLGVILELYSENLGIDKGIYLSSVISILSLIVAIGMPLYLTEKNRRRAEEVADDNQKYNEKMILDNRKHSEDMMQNEIRMRAVPILSYDIVGVSGIDENKDNEEVKRYIFVIVKNVSDRIATSLLYRNDRIYGIDGRILFEGEIVKHILLKKPFLLGDEKSLKVNVSDIVNIMSKNEIEYQPLTICMYFADIYNNEYIEKIFIGIKREEQDRFEATFHYTSEKKLTKYN